MVFQIRLNRGLGVHIVGAPERQQLLRMVIAGASVVDRFFNVLHHVLLDFTFIFLQTHCENPRGR